MCAEKWGRLERELLFSTPYYDICHDRYQLPAGGVGDYYYIDIAGSSMIVPEGDQGRLTLVRQFRYLMQRPSLEFPAGGIQRGWAPLACAQQELREEAGLVASSWRELGEFAPYNGASAEICHVFVASGLSSVRAEPEPTEEIEVVALTLAELQAAVASGEIWDGMTLAALRLYEVGR